MNGAGGAVTRDDLRERNRRLVRVLLAIVAALLVGSLLVGIRW
jgi:hypothetical protein